MVRSVTGANLATAQRRARARSSEATLRAQPSDHVLAMVIGAITFALALLLLAAPSAK